MKFYGEPNLHVIEHRTNRILCIFNDKGEFVTEDEKLSEKLKQHFRYDDKKKKGGKQ